MSQVHPCARTTPRTRAEINASSAGVTVLASQYNITVPQHESGKGVKIHRIALMARTR